jgi:hypothetical protein
MNIRYSIHRPDPRIWRISDQGGQANSYATGGGCEFDTTDFSVVLDSFYAGFPFFKSFPVIAGWQCICADVRGEFPEFARKHLEQPSPRSYRDFVAEYPSLMPRKNKRPAKMLRPGVIFVRRHGARQGTIRISR